MTRPRSSEVVRDGEGPATSDNPRCQWITCTRNAVTYEDGWNFCGLHLAAHREDNVCAFEQPEQPPAPECGTPAGYARHLREKELTCQACRDAHNEYNRLFAKHSTRQLAPCGTYGGYRRHQTYHTPICDPCKQAYLAYNKANWRRSA